MRFDTISRKIRKLRYYTVPDAGRKVGMGRSQAYRAAAAGLMPVERSGKFMLVPRQRWDRKVRQLLSDYPGRIEL
jgi:hypothetical protein